jgi:hypothetical protein
LIFFNVAYIGTMSCTEMVPVNCPSGRMSSRAIER